jgi:hypothetical protein
MIDIPLYASNTAKVRFGEAFLVIMGNQLILSFSAASTPASGRSRSIGSIKAVTCKEVSANDCGFGNLGVLS